MITLKSLNIIPKTLLFLFIAAHLSACTSQENTDITFEATVTGIKDGDTIELLKDNEKLTLRLSEIDCPEKNQPYGKHAKKFVSDFCFNQKVQVMIEKEKEKDQYGRYLGKVKIGFKVLQEELLKNGLAWHYKKYSTDEYLEKLENDARKSKIGLWKDSNPTPPWDWRRKK